MAESTSSSNTVLILGGLAVEKFINEIVSRVDTTSALSNVSSSLMSTAQTVEEVRLHLGCRTVLLAEAPGLDHTNLSDAEVLTRVYTYLLGKFSEGVHRWGIIFLVEADRPPYNVGNVRGLRRLKDRCRKAGVGRAALKRTMVALTKTDIALSSDMDEVVRAVQRYLEQYVDEVPIKKIPQPDAEWEVFREAISDRSFGSPCDVTVQNDLQRIFQRQLRKDLTPQTVDCSSFFKRILTRIFGR